MIEEASCSSLKNGMQSFSASHEIFDDGDFIVDVKESENSKVRSPSRLGFCEVCAAKPSIYTCPKCEVKTCSLPCVKIHKKELNCNGIRDRTKYIPLRQMKSSDFMSDYYFLEEATRYTAARKADHIKNYTRYNKLLPPRLFSLRKATAERKTTLRFLLPNFKRHKENTSFYDWSQKRLYWRIEWIFMNAFNVNFIDERCDEDEKLERLLEKYVSNDNCMKGLEYYQSVGIYNLKLLLKAEGIKCCNRRFYELDCKQSLRQNLSNKTLVEFPSIYVTYEENLEGFEIIDSDEDVFEETKKHEQDINAFAKEQQQKHWNKRKAAAEDTGNLNDMEDAKKLKQILREKKFEEKTRKLEEYEKKPNNYLFSDEQLLEILTSSEEEES